MFSRQGRPLYTYPQPKQAYNITTFVLVRFCRHWHQTRYCVLQHKVSPPKYDSLTRARVNPGLTSPGPRLSLAVLDYPPTAPAPDQSFLAIHRPAPATVNHPGYPPSAPAPTNHPGYPSSAPAPDHPFLSLIPSDSCSRIIDLNCRRRPIHKISSCAVGVTRLTAAWPVPTYRDHPTLTRGI